MTKNALLNFLCFLRARLYSFALFIFFLKHKKIDIAFISNIRDETDARNFGFNFRKYTILPWIVQRYNPSRRVNLIGQLFMIGVTTADINNDKTLAKGYAMEAIRMAKKKGARVVLFGANTKRLLDPNALMSMFPKITFTLGDNYTANLLESGIDKAFQISNINPLNSNVLVIAPYGLLGKIAFEHTISMVLGGKNTNGKVIGLCNPGGNRDIASVSEKLQKKANAILGRSGESLLNDDQLYFVDSFDKITCKIDAVIACDSGKPFCTFDKKIITKLKKTDKMLMIDPCQPPNLDYSVFLDNLDIVARYDAGNAHSPYLKHFMWGHKLLRMPEHTVFGCFAETFVLALSGSMIHDVDDWFSVSAEKKGLLKKFEDEFFSLAPLSNYGKPA